MFQDGLGTNGDVNGGMEYSSFHTHGVPMGRPDELPRNRIPRNTSNTALTSHRISWRAHSKFCLVFHFGARDFVAMDQMWEVLYP
jgi:hypothetical protein